MSHQALMELFRGKGAHADPLACVEDIPVEEAQRRIAGFPHSIADLVFHMNYWMQYELRRIRNEKPQYPEHNAESFPAEQSSIDAEQWDRLRRDFSWLLAEFAKLAESSSEELSRQIESSPAALEQRSSRLNSLEAILWQMVAHNSYHTGQIAVIRRTLGLWPPKAGGDTW